MFKAPKSEIHPLTAPLINMTKRTLLVLLILVTSLPIAWVYWASSKVQLAQYTTDLPECEKIWSARGVYNAREDQNSIESIGKAFALGAVGAEVDVFYDTTLERYIVSHDYPYNLKNGEVLTLESLLAGINSVGYLWLDFKKLRHLEGGRLKSAINRLSKISDEYDLSRLIYVEGSDPINLGAFSAAGFNTIFDIHPLPSSNWLSGFVLAVYKSVFHWNGFTVMSVQYANEALVLFDQTAASRLGDVPLFVYHVPDTVENINRLRQLDNVKAFLVGRGLGIDRFNYNQCF
ncbi:MAG: hypothetical protein ACI810_002203 [Gammaproteobacteria bacterium]|jgi:hypothetical protein